MKKSFLAAMIMVMGTGSALAASGDDLAGGQITFNGLVQPGTCVASVVDGGKTSTNVDGTVLLDTALKSDVEANTGVDAAATGVNPKDFSIRVDCTNGDAAMTDVDLQMSSASFANSNGTLNNNTSVTLAGTKMAQGVNIAVHEVTGTGLALVNMIDHSAAHDLTLDPTTKVGVYNLRASYVKAPTGTVTNGAVTTNAMYSITYK